MSRANPNLILAAGVATVALTLAAYLVAAAKGIDSAPIIAIVGPPIAALFAAPALGRIERKTDQAVEQTNGALNGPLADLADQVAQLRDDLRPVELPYELSTDYTAPLPPVELGETPPSTPPSSTH